MDGTVWADRCLRQNQLRNYVGDSYVVEGYGAGKIAVILRVTTVDLVATEAKLAAIFAQFGGRLGDKTAWLFREKGQLVVSKYANGISEDAIVLAALGAGAEDVIFDEGDLVKIMCHPSKLAMLQDILTMEDLDMAQVGVIDVPRDLFELAEYPAAQQMAAFMDALVAVEEVTAVAANFQFSDRFGEKLGYLADY